MLRASRTSTRAGTSTPDRRFLVPPLEEPVAFIKDEADIVDEPLALALFERPPVVFEEPVAFIEDVDEVDTVDEPLSLVVFEHHFFMEADPLNVNPPLVSFLWLYSFTLSRD